MKLNHKDLIEDIAEAICNSHPCKSISWSEIVRLSKHDGYLVAKSFVKETRIQAEAALKAVQDYMPNMLYNKLKNLKGGVDAKKTDLL